jgi:hypothetical protein
MDKDIEYVMEMVLGDYLYIIHENAKEHDFESFKQGCKKICKKFKLNIKKLDTDKLL